MSAKWVFLTHTLEQVGPPVYLLHLLEWMGANTDTEVEVVALKGGALADRFRRLGGVTVIGEPDPVRPGKRTEAPATAARDAALRTKLRHLRDAELVHVNTAWSVRALPYLPESDATVVAHVHELDVGLDYHLSADHLRLLRESASWWVAASQAVADNLVAQHGVPVDRLAVHHEMVDAFAGESGTTVDLERELGIPAGTPIVGTAAVVNWRKAPDLFLQLAGELQRQRPDLDVHLVWIGGHAGEPDWQRFAGDLAAAGLTGRVHLVPAVERPLEWMRAFEVFALTAREDAFPLACLEAASVGCPTICFDGGGMPEFVAPDCGIVVPYPDVRGFADAAARLLDDPAERRRLGDNARSEVRRQHDVSVAAPKIHQQLVDWARR